MPNLLSLPERTAKGAFDIAPSTSQAVGEGGVDIFNFHGQEYLISVCYLTGYFEVDRIPSKAATVLRQQFARHDIPVEVVWDNSPFGAAEFQAFAK